MDLSEVKHLPKVDHTPAHLDVPSQILLKAAAIIEERGWIQGEAKNRYGFCVVGALDEACGGKPMSRNLEAWQRAEAVMGKNCAIWNDQRGRTKDEVVAKLRAVALGL